MFLFRAGVPVRSYPAAVGRPDFRTPLGDFAVINRLEDMDWYVPRSIQREMERDGKPVLTRVPPGPDNPLGRHWIGLDMPRIGIHGTNEPDNVYGFVSHGCVRLHPDDIAQLFGILKRGSIGTIAYQPLLLARDERGAIWFEANPDVYDRAPASLETVRAMAAEQGIDAESIDWPRVQAALDARDGQAREVGLGPQFSGLRNLPGFMIPSGSNADLSRRISAVSTGDL
ncbi:MAG TPA: L,D-transpeptidase [Burkholderiaceae bacterium]|nr:L,D-transpeptidase [Burkholderiaceae bacterium]